MLFKCLFCWFFVKFLYSLNKVIDCNVKDYSTDNSSLLEKNLILYIYFFIFLNIYCLNFSVLIFKKKII